MDAGGRRFMRQPRYPGRHHDVFQFDTRRHVSRSGGRHFRLYAESVRDRPTRPTPAASECDAEAAEKIALKPLSPMLRRKINQPMTTEVPHSCSAPNLQDPHGFTQTFIRYLRGEERLSEMPRAETRANNRNL